MYVTRKIIYVIITQIDEEQKFNCLKEQPVVFQNILQNKKLRIAMSIQHINSFANELVLQINQSHNLKFKEIEKSKIGKIKQIAREIRNIELLVELENPNEPEI
jgi:hypothetical protein